MAKNLSNLRAQVRTFLDEAIVADWTAAEVDREINHYYMRVYTAVTEVYENYYNTKSTASTVADQQEYQLPSDFWKIIRVEVDYADTDASTPQRALPIRLDDVSRDLGNEAIGLTTQRNPAYYIRGDYIGFIPVPDEAGTDNITLWYVAIPDELSAAADTISIPFPDRYGGLISLGAAGTLLRKGQQEEVVAAKYLADFEVGLERMKQELEDRVADDVRGVTDVVGLDTNFDRYHSV